MRDKTNDTFSIRLVFHFSTLFPPRLSIKGGTSRLILYTFKGALLLQNFKKIRFVTDAGKYG